MIYIPETQFDKEAATPENYFETLSNDYEVKINGADCPANVCRVSAVPFNRLWPGFQRDISQSELASYINFYGDEEVVVEVKCNRVFKTAVVRPLSKGIATKQKGDTVTFTLKENGNYVFEMDDAHFALHIFYNAPMEFPTPDEVTYYFGPGIHRPLLLNLKSNESVFVHPEAIVYTTVYSCGTENIRIFGGGVLNNCCQERVSGGWYDYEPTGNIRICKTCNIRIEGVILLDSSNWVCSLFHCDNILIDNIKIVGQWKYNTDGIDLVNSSNAKIKNCFIRSFDDSLCVKALYNHKCCENIEVENCVCWCDWGKTLEIGLETSAEEYRNISYKNCDLIHNGTAAMAVSNGHYANIHDIFYENINVEFQSYTHAAVYQENDAMHYPENTFAPIGELLRIVNVKFSQGYSVTIADERDKNYGKNHDITYKNIAVYKDSGMADVKLRLCSYSPDSLLENVKISGISVNGIKVDDFAEFDVISQNTNDIFYNGEKQTI